VMMGTQETDQSKRGRTVCDRNRPTTIPSPRWLVNGALHRVYAKGPLNSLGLHELPFLRQKLRLTSFEKPDSLPELS
jgi:hypothetical protein